MFLAKIFITLKSTVNDPQGQTIQASLRELGFDTVQSCRAGKYMEICLDEVSEKGATERVSNMCDQLLAHPVIEEYHFELKRLDQSRET